MFSRHEPSPFSALVVCSSLSWCLGWLLAATPSSAQSVSVKSTATPSSTEVVYLLANSTLLTYDVDRTTGFPTEEGSGVTLDSATNTVLVPSANDRFVYVTGYDSTLSENLWVYATDPTGVPLLPAVQTVSLTDGSFGTGNFVINPNGTLAFAVEETLNPEGEMLARIIKFTIDPTTGFATKGAKAVANYPPNGPCTPVAEASLGIYGFNPNGGVMYDNWVCNYPFANDSETYFSRTVNTSTGALGADQQVFDWADGNEGLDVVSFTPSSLIYFSIPSNDSQGLSSVNVYSLLGAPRFSCTAAMLEACGYGLWNSLDRTGRFDFIQISSDSTQVTRIEPAAKKIVDTGNYVQGTVQAFSPDDVLIYTSNPDSSNPWLYPIYVFDPTTGAVTFTGGEIFADGFYPYVIPAIRH
jgi:hypothetical protein